MHPALPALIPCLWQLGFSSWCWEVPLSPKYVGILPLWQRASSDAERIFDQKIHKSRALRLPLWDTRMTGIKISALKSHPELAGCICFGRCQLGYTSTAGMSLSEGDAQIYFQVVCTRLCLDVFGF